MIDQFTITMLENVFDVSCPHAVFGAILLKEPST